ncbi:Multidrug resistance protein MdtA [Burkholderiaceae bacterium]|nr:Multidrug resistance protein MdtA [Burkholderiaceae bacterium]
MMLGLYSPQRGRISKTRMTNQTVAALLALVVTLAACGKNDAPAAAGAGSAPGSGPSAGGGPPVSVSTVPAQQRDFEVQLEATGTVTALNSVDVKPQITSTISKAHIREGQFIKAGQLLFTLDARTEETNVARARAALQKNLAALADAQRQLARSKELFAQNFVSQVAVDQNQTLVEAQQAAVAADRAALQAAQVELSHSRIVAPNSGRAGIVNVFPGTLVQPSSPPLVTITQLDPIAVTFNLPQRHLGDALQSLRTGGGSVTAVLPEGRGTLIGKLAFVDNSVDANSGTVKVRAVFDNRDEKLWPGAFVGVKLAVRTLKDAIIVPHAAIVQSARGRIVYVVEPGNKAGMRQVELLHAAGQDAVVSGVKPGERVVLDGRENVRPGGALVERPADASNGTRGGRGSAPAPAGGQPA